MSFAIAVIDPNNKLYLAADTKSTSISGLVNYKNINKIIEISETTALAITGKFMIAKVIADWFIEEFRHWWTFDKMIESLKRLALVGNVVSKRELNTQANCVFILAHQEQETPMIALITLDGDKVQVFSEPLQSFGHQFYFVNPTDCSFGLCNLLCCLACKSKGNTETKDMIIEIVKSVANESRFVNDEVQIWNPYQT